MIPILAAGDVLINPANLTYAVVEMDSEGLHLRLGFANPSGGPSELRLTGVEARSVLGWLRSQAEHLDSGPVSSRLSSVVSPDRFSRATSSRPFFRERIPLRTAVG